MTSEEIVSGAADRRAVRLNISIRPETKARLDDVRAETGSAINVSGVCDAAINSELDRLEKPGLVDVIARLRVENDRRRGAPYRLGHGRGEEWARDRASWIEICRYSALDERAVNIGEGVWISPDKERRWIGPRFEDKFRPPEQDYGRWRPEAFGAPGFRTADGVPVTDMNECDQYWRGWLAGVKEVFDAVSTDIAPIADPGDIEPDDTLDDIPF